MKNTQLVFIPSPGLSHLTATVEMAKLLLDRDDRLSITVLIMKLPTDNFVDKYVAKISLDSNHSTSRLCFTNLPDQQHDTSDSKTFRLFDYIDNQIVHVTEIVRNLMSESSVAGLVLDMFCTKFIDVGEEFGLPSYVFFTSSACSLGLFSQLTTLKFEHNLDLKQYKDSDEELSISCLSIPVPAKVLPALFVTDSPITNIFFTCFRRFRETKGIMINTFYELETYALDTLSQFKIPKVYPVGPIINLENQTDSHRENRAADNNNEIEKWLDNQPESSVVFLCFGSMGSFEGAQVKEIALALERSNHRFLWSLRKPGPKGSTQFPTEFEDFREVLPEGFLERTEGIGKLIGWAPQVKVLSHPAVGGFVSHCGWNSTLESLWCGVPMATFPLYAEQQVNAFELVKELGLAESIRIDYQKSFAADSGEQEIVAAEEIEAGIRRLMAEDGEGGVRVKVKEMQKKSRMALAEGGSSYNAINLFIDDVIKNVE